MRSSLASLSPFSPSLLLTLATLHTPSQAFWRTACSVVQTGRIDTVLNPGTISGHAHKFAGASNINPDSTFDTLLESNCTSCEVTSDLSSYWTPQLYFAHSNGTFESVPNEGMTVYYVGVGGNSSNTVPFPPDFKMISGDSKLRSYDNETLTYLNTRPVADRVSFHCIDENNDIAEQHYMFDTNCVNGMRAQINFPSCWDGVNAYLPNSSHVDYTSGIDYGVCPPDYPVYIPHLFYEVLYWTNDIDQSAGGEFVFSNGDPTGYSFHGDFMFGWDVDIFANAVENCLYSTADDGVIANCPILAPDENVNFPRTCLPQPPVIDEPVLGLLDQLPGCNPISPGPAPVPQEICPVNSTTPISEANGTSTSISYVTPTAFPSSYYDETITLTATAAAESTGGIFVGESSTDSTTDSSTVTTTTTTTTSTSDPTSSAATSSSVSTSSTTTVDPSASSVSSASTSASTSPTTAANPPISTVTVTVTVDLPFSTSPSGFSFPSYSSLTLVGIPFSMAVTSTDTLTADSTTDTTTTTPTSDTTITTTITLSYTSVSAILVTSTNSSSPVFSATGGIFAGESGTLIGPPASSNSTILTAAGNSTTTLISFTTTFVTVTRPFTEKITSIVDVTVGASSSSSSISSSITLARRLARWMTA